MNSTRVLATAVAAGTATTTLITTSHATLIVGLGLTVTALTMFCGVALPAVFFTSSTRRRDARAVLTLILSLFRGQGG